MQKELETFLSTPYCVTVTLILNLIIDFYTIWLPTSTTRQLLRHEFPTSTSWMNQVLPFVNYPSNGNGIIDFLVLCFLPLGSENESIPEVEKFKFLTFGCFKFWFLEVWHSRYCQVLPKYFPRKWHNVSFLMFHFIDIVINGLNLIPNRRKF